MHWLPGNIGKLITKLILPQNLYLLFSSQFLVVILFSEYVLFTFLSITVVLIFFPFQFWSWVQFNVSCQTICNSFLSCILDGYNSSSGIFFFLNFYLLFSERERGRHQFVIPLIYAFFGWFFFFFFEDFTYLFLGRGEGRKRGRETLMCERNIDGLPSHVPQPGTWLATQACILTRNQTGDLSVCGAMPNPMSHTSQGHWLILVCALTRDWTCNAGVFGQRHSDQLNYLARAESFLKKV